MAGQGVDEVADELYAVPPARFVAARDEAMRLARDAGHRDLARQIGRLRKPTLSAWAVNLLVRASGPGVEGLLALGEQLRSAQQLLQGEQLRRLNEQRRETVGTLSRGAARLAAEAGYPLSGAALVEVEQTLAAALAEEAAADTVREGRLTKPLQHVGMGAEPLLAPDLSVAPAPGQPEAPPTGGAAGAESAEDADASAPASRAARPGPATGADDELTRRRRHREQRREAELQRATTELDQAEGRLKRAEEQARQAEERTARAERRLAELQREHDEAVRERDEARRRARSAARVRDDAQRRVQRLTEQS